VAHRVARALSGAGYVEQELAVSHDVVYAFGPHSLSAPRAQDGATLWTRPTSAQIGGIPPMLADQVIVAEAEDGTTYGFDATTGQELWHAQTQQDWLARMAAWEDTVFAGGQGSVLALGARTGAVKWSANVGGLVEHSLQVWQP
jgi:outer membrane protein assembly factor BamB